MTTDDLAALIRAGLPQAQVRVASDDNVHFNAVVVDPAFESKGRVARHQMVYRCLGERMGGEIHALSLDTRTPSEHAAQGGG